MFTPEQEILQLRAKIGELESRIKYLEGQDLVDFDNEDDDRFYVDECDECGLQDGEHKTGCPNDDSPFALLLRDGYD